MEYYRQVGDHFDEVKELDWNATQVFLVGGKFVYSVDKQCIKEECKLSELGTLE
jgi:hypothetical protein